MDYILSRYSHAIKKCCMSCGYKKQFTEIARKCAFKNKIVDPTDVCENYILSAGLYEAGSGKGEIKSKAHLYDKFYQALEENNSEQ